VDGNMEKNKHGTASLKFGQNKRNNIAFKLKNNEIKKNSAKSANMRNHSTLNKTCGMTC
jgi:hypothetical protein